LPIIHVAVSPDSPEKRKSSTVTELYECFKIYISRGLKKWVVYRTCCGFVEQHIKVTEFVFKVVFSTGVPWNLYKGCANGIQEFYRVELRSYGN